MIRGVYPEGAENRSIEVLRFLILGSRGGPTRRKILTLLGDCPQNTHRLCLVLGLNYGTVASHLRVLERFGLVVPIGASRYSRGYCIAPGVRGSREWMELLQSGSTRRRV